MFFLFALSAAALQTAGPIDFPTLDTAIERCDRAAALPVFAAEAQRRSAALTAFYQEQAQLVAHRLAAAGKRRVLREGAAPATGLPQPTDQDLALLQLALDDRQRALDDERRLETMRQEALDLKRQYFLTRCTASKKPG